MREQYQQPEQENNGPERGYGPGWGRRGGHRGHRAEGRGFGPRGPWQGFGYGPRGPQGPQSPDQGYGPQGPQQGFDPGFGPQGHGPQQGFDPRRGPFQGQGFGFGPGFRAWSRHYGFGFGPDFQGQHHAKHHGPHGFRGWGWGNRPQFSKEDQIAFLEKAQGFLENRLADVKAKLAELRQDQARTKESGPAQPSEPPVRNAGWSSSNHTDASML